MSNTKPLTLPSDLFKSEYSKWSDLHPLDYPNRAFDAFKAGWNAALEKEKSLKETPFH
jgi:hypothetical protein